MWSRSVFSYNRDQRNILSSQIIHEIGHLRFLSGAISQKRIEIVDFTNFYETFWSECRERNECSPKRRPGSPLGVAEAEDGTNEATEMNGKNVS